MATVTFWVEKIIEENPFLEEALARGIVNNAALAEMLIPEIEQKLKKKVKFSAVNMAIRRLGEKISSKNFIKIKFDQNSDITLKSGLAMMAISKDSKTLDAVYSFSDKVLVDKDNFFTFTQGVYEINTIFPSKYTEKIKDLLDDRKIIRTTNDLCGLTMRLPKNAIDIPGYIFVISRALAWNNISIIEVVST
jgi:hypothetical protein